MVANLTIATLVGFEPRMASSLIMSMKPLRSLDEDARGPRPSTVLHGVNPAEGWMPESIRAVLRPEKHIS
jgi:hypothetical protein